MELQIKGAPEARNLAESVVEAFELLISGGTASVSIIRVEDQYLASTEDLEVDAYLTISLSD